MSVDRLLAQHIHILEHIDTLHRLTSDALETALPRITPVRWALARDLLLHFARVEAEAYIPLLADIRPMAVRRAKEAMGEIASFTRDYLAYMQKWTGEAPAGDWQGYQASMRAITARMRSIMDTEARDFMALLPAQPSGESPADHRANHASDAWKIREMLFEFERQ